MFKFQTVKVTKGKKETPEFHVVGTFDHPDYEDKAFDFASFSKWLKSNQQVVSEDYQKLGVDEQIARLACRQLGVDRSNRIRAGEKETKVSEKLSTLPMEAIHAMVVASAIANISAEEIIFGLCKRDKERAGALLATYNEWLKAQAQAQEPEPESTDDDEETEETEA